MEELITHRGHTIKIIRDGNPESPREWDNLGKMVCFHRKYRLGDKDHEFPTPQDFIDFREAEEKANRTLVELPIFLLDHSGLAMRTGPFHEDPQGWDSGLVGWIYADEAMIRKEYGIKAGKPVTLDIIHKVGNVLQSEVDVFNQYLQDDVWGYMIEGPATDDSCWGFYGFKTCLEEAKSIVNYSVKNHKTSAVLTDGQSQE